MQVADSGDPLRTLRGQVEDLEASFRKLRAEFLDQLDRNERIMERVTKRAQRAEAREDPAPVNGSPPRTHGPDPVSAGILARRRAPWQRPGGG